MKKITGELPAVEIKVLKEMSRNNFFSFAKCQKFSAVLLLYFHLRTIPPKVSPIDRRISRAIKFFKALQGFSL